MPIWEKTTRKNNEVCMHVNVKIKMFTGCNTVHSTYIKHVLRHRKDQWG